MAAVIDRGFAAFAVHARVSRRAACRSRYHGMSHWRSVAALGIEIASRTSDVDAYVVVLFAMFHDLERRDDGPDAEHGLRAASLVRRLGASTLGLNLSDLQRLEEACRLHSDGQRTEDPTVGTCWDADRLTLGALVQRRTADSCRLSRDARRSS